MDKMPFFELEELLDSLKDINEKEEEERKKREGTERGPNFNASSMMRQMQSAASSSKMPSMPNFKL